MKPHLFVLLATLLLLGCAQNASGPLFSLTQSAPISSNHTRIYIYRTKAVYLMQAPTVVAAEISIDGRSVGRLANGGYLTTDIEVGHHFISAATGQDVETQQFDVAGHASVYIRVYDKTRMEGIPILAGGVVGGIIGGAIVGAVIAQGNTWGVEFVREDAALSELHPLSRSN